MNIVVVGNDISFEECQTKFGNGHQYAHLAELSSTDIQAQTEVIFDFSPDWPNERLDFYANNYSVPIFINTIFTTLSSLQPERKIKAPIFGFCGLPTFFNRSILEITTDTRNTDILEGIMASLKTDFRMVRDQVGMVTPRIVCMIVNEAYETLHQGVASQKDIDLSMKLGTNYPYGPFEWGDKIGLENVKKLLVYLMAVKGEKGYRPNF